MRGFLVNAVPSLIIAVIGPFFYIYVDILRDDLSKNEICKYENREFPYGNSDIFTRWYLDSIPLSVVSSLSTVALGSIVSIAAIFDPHFLPLEYVSAFLFIFVIYWPLQILLTSIVSLNPECRKYEKVLLTIINILPILAFIGFSANFIKDIAIKLM